MPIVYSTDPDGPSSEGPNKKTPQLKDSPVKGQVARIWRDSKRRKGKTVTVVGGLRHDPATLERLCTDLKKHCGAGGTVREGEIEIQGDQREKVAARLQALGYKTRFAGG
jgi:translation initiation factor 1